MSERSESVRAGNDRHATIARWIDAQYWPADAEPAELVLYCWIGDDREDVVTRIPFGSVSPELGFKLSEQIDNYATDAGQHCRARLEFLDAKKETLTSKNFRGLCRRGGEVMGIASLDGSTVSLITQLQTHLHAVMGKFIGQSEMIEQRGLQHLEVVDRLFERVERTFIGLHERENQRAEIAEEKVRELEELVEKATAAAEENAKAVEAAKDNDRVGQVIELVQAKMLQDGGNKK
jgi:hypothetical protein